MVEGKIEVTLPALSSHMVLRQKSAFAVQHLMAAARFSRMCGDIEFENAGKPLGNFFDVEIACVSATIMLATASLESNINEYFSEMETSFPDLSKSLREVLFELIEKKSILEKYQYALKFKGKSKFPTGEPPYQNVNALIRLRNALVHFKPEWHDEQEEHKKIERQLAGKFPINPFIGENGVFFPQQCISYGCTQWAVTSALRFMENFCDLSGLPFRFGKFLNRLNPKIDGKA
jgi:hypothetical protein